MVSGRALQLIPMGTDLGAGLGVGGGEGVLEGDQISGVRRAWDGRDGHSWLWLVQSAEPGRRVSR